MNEKLVLKKNLRFLREKKIVLCHGCYDILTFAHVRHLEWAKAQGDILVVSVTSNANVARHKGEGRPHWTHDKRAEQVGALNCVDYVVICRADSATPILDQLRPDYYVKGSDTVGNPGDSFKDECGFVESYGGKVLFSPVDEEEHTSEVRSKLLNDTK